MRLALIYTKNPDNVSALKVLATAAFYGVPLIAVPVQRYSIEDQSITSPLCRCPISGALLYLQVRERDHPHHNEEVIFSVEERQPHFAPPVFGVNAMLRLLYRLSLRPCEVDPRSVASHSPFALSSEEMWMDMAISQVEQPHAEAIESLFLAATAAPNGCLMVEENHVERANHLEQDDEEEKKKSPTRGKASPPSSSTNIDTTSSSSPLPPAPPPSLIRVLEQLEDRLRVQTFLAGERLSLSDISMAFSIHWMYRCFHWRREPDSPFPVPAGVNSRYPSVHRHYRTVLHQPAVEEVLKREGLTVW